jgi:hypothetical protein
MKKQVTMSAASAISEWLNAESKSFTAMCGESFTHAEVIMTAIGTVAILWMTGMAVYVANWLAGGAA